MVLMILNHGCWKMDDIEVDVVSDERKTKRCNLHRTQPFSYDGIPINCAGLSRSAVWLSLRKVAGASKERDENAPEDARLLMAEPMQHWRNVEQNGA